MTLRINTNISAMNAHRSLMSTNDKLNKSLEKLSSGLRINKASDDAAGLSISETLRAQVRGLGQAERNAQDAISLLNTAEGGADEIHNILQRMRELAVQGSNGTLVTADRQAIGAEYNALRSEIDDIASKTKFNGQSLINGNSTFTFQTGYQATDVLAVAMSTLTASTTTSANGLGLQTVGAADFTLSTVSTASAFQSAIASLDNAIAVTSTLRTQLGAAVNRLDHKISSLGVGRENIAAAESRIRDVDMAKEMTDVSRRQILFQSGTSMLSQANSNPQNVLSLFR